MAIQLVIQLLLAPALIVLVWRSRPKSRGAWLLETVAMGLFLLWVFATARWDLTTYYLRLLVLPAFGVASWRAYRRIEQQPAPATVVGLVRAHAGGVLLLMVALVLNVVTVRGFGFDGEAIDLAYPLRDGVYYVGGGGATRWLNNHHAFPPQDYALDIVRLNWTGNRASVGSASELDRYAIFGNPIYSPCDGTIMVAVDRHLDQIPPNRDRVNLSGNHVVVECQGAEVILAHMKLGSVVVAEGETVAKGERVGAVGNSGHSSQPHLHVHAKRGGTPGQMFTGEGVPITFEGRFLLRNSLFTGR